MSGCAKSLAAVVFTDRDQIHSIVQDFAAQVTEQGIKLGGIIQVPQNTPGCPCQETHVLDLVSGQRIAILQNLGSQSQSCRADTAAFAIVSGFITKAIEENAGLIFINRFGKLEAEGKGLWAEIGEAVSCGIPALVCVSVKYLSDWRGFAGDFAEELPCSPQALQDWWQSLALVRKAAE